MPGIEPGSKRVTSIRYMCSRFVILMAFVSGKKANSCPEVLQIKSSGGDLILRSIGLHRLAAIEYHGSDVRPALLGDGGGK